jgi:hypothetical protein
MQCVYVYIIIYIYIILCVKLYIIFWKNTCMFNLNTKYSSRWIDDTCPRTGLKTEVESETRSTDDCVAKVGGQCIQMTSGWCKITATRWSLASADLFELVIAG